MARLVQKNELETLTAHAVNQLCDLAVLCIAHNAFKDRSHLQPDAQTLFEGVSAILDKRCAPGPDKVDTRRSTLTTVCDFVRAGDWEESAVLQLAGRLSSYPQRTYNNDQARKFAKAFHDLMEGKVGFRFYLGLR